MADNQNFIREAQAADTAPAVIKPASGPFTTEMIRTRLLDVSFGKLEYAELAEELNQRAYDHYNKK